MCIIMRRASLSACGESTVGGFGVTVSGMVNNSCTNRKNMVPYSCLEILSLVSIFTIPDNRFAVSARLPVYCEFKEEKMRKVLSTLLIAAMILSLFAVMPLSASAWDYSTTIHDSGNYSYYLYSNGNACITRCRVKSTSITIPSKIAGHTVTAIEGYGSPHGDGKSIFEYAKVKKVILPKTLKRIGDCAFIDCRYLTSVTIPDSVTAIGLGSFDGCSALKSISLPDGIRTLSGSFASCTSLVSVKLPAKLKTLDYGCFLNCTALKSIVIPDYVETIGTSQMSAGGPVFYNCTNLETVIIGKRVKSIGLSDFNNCPKLKTVSIPASVTKIYSSFGKKVTWPYSGEWTNVAGFTVKGYKGTAAETFAKQNGFKFVALQFATPKVTKIQNTDYGLKISWGKVAGAAKYRLYRKAGSGAWKKVINTKATSYTDESLKSGVKYTYTVCCVTADGKRATSAFNKTGKSVFYLAAPMLRKYVWNKNGISIVWDKVNGAAKYYVYRKEMPASFANSQKYYSNYIAYHNKYSWKYTGVVTGKSFTDKKANTKHCYVYTVRAADKSGKILSGSRTYYMAIMPTQYGDGVYYYT